MKNKFLQPLSHTPGRATPPSRPRHAPPVCTCIIKFEKIWKKKLKKIFATLKPLPQPCHAPLTRPRYAFALLNLKKIEKKK